MSADGHVHNAAGVASCFAAVSNQECSVSLALEKRLRLQSVDVAQSPGALVVMRKVLVIVHHRILTGGRKRKRRDV